MTSTNIETNSHVGQRRLWGGVTMAGALCYIIVGVIVATTENEADPIVAVLSLLWALGCICGLVGMATLGAVGKHVLGRVALAVAFLAYALVAVDALLVGIGMYAADEASPLFALSRLSTLVGMLLIGIAALLTRRWAGWRKFSPFALPLAVPISILFGVVTGTIPTIVFFVALAWFVIGYAIWSTPMD